MKTSITLAGIVLALLPLTAMAAPATPPAHKMAPAPVSYKAACGMTYSAADAKKYHYLCPMDNSKLVAMKPAHK
jgi:hypothetical protein